MMRSFCRVDLHHPLMSYVLTERLVFKRCVALLLKKRGYYISGKCSNFISSVDYRES